jgi:uncharacterized repeat protein (TIGR03843 family)
MMENTDQAILDALEMGQVTLLGEFVWGSNYTFSAKVEHGDLSLPGVYKPTRGERPLWDFPRSTLAKREVAAYIVSQFLGWRLVPPTVYRKDAPAGPGSLQLYIEHNPEYHYFNLKDSDRQRLRPVALFDLLINNADRKGSHVLFDAQKHIWLIDHGICFHREEKLRTVIWDFAGEPLPPDLCFTLERLIQNLTPACELAASLAPYLNREEIAAIGRRAQALLASGKFPDPHPNRRPYPWPPV